MNFFSNEVQEHVTAYAMNRYKNYGIDIEHIGYNKTKLGEGIDLVLFVTLPVMYEWLVMYYTNLDAKQSRYYMRNLYTSSDLSKPIKNILHKMVYLVLDNSA